MTNSILELTLTSLEQALRVEHVATFENLRTCAATDEVPTVRSRTDLEDFDYWPVEREGQIIGVLERSALPDQGEVVDAMRGLNNETLMAASEPLIDFVRSLRTGGFRLVVRRGEVAGIVTKSDIQKLPVRLLVFALVTHLESVMAKLIVVTHPQDAWLESLSDGRRKKVCDKHSELREERLEVDLIEFTELCDKYSILQKSGLTKLSDKGRDKVDDEFDHIQQLRNQVAHAASLPESDEDLVDHFVAVFESTEFWIEHFSARLPDSPPS